MTKFIGTIAAAGMLVLGSATAWAHHPFAAEYDSNKPAQVEGKVVKIDWTNPHAFLTIDARGDNGKTERWKVELGNPAALTKHGWTRSTVHAGDAVAIKGWYARDGKKMINADGVKLTSSGKELDAVSSFRDSSAAN